MRYYSDLHRAKHIRKRHRRAAPVFGLWLFLLFCCLLSTYFFLNSTFFSVGSIVVNGNNLLTAEELIALSGLNEGINIFKLDASLAVQKIQTHPYIKEIKISRKLPQTIVLKVLEREPCAYVLGQDGFIAIDLEGIYLNKTNNIMQNPLPVISGVNVGADNKPGNSIMTSGLQTALDLLGILDKVILENVAEIIAATPDSLALKTIQGVEIRFGKPEDMERKVAVIQELLIDNGVIINNQTVEYIDLRYNTSPAIKRKN